MIVLTDDWASKELALVDRIINPVSYLERVKTYIAGRVVTNLGFDYGYAQALVILIEIQKEVAHAVYLDINND